MDLDRFKNAQDEESEGYQAAMREMQTASKQSHWIWYIFPQLEGLGASSTSRFYALADTDEAIAYLADRVLGPRLVEISETVAVRVRGGMSLNTLMSSATDAGKLVSCMTLFGGLAGKLNADGNDESLKRLSRAAQEILAAGEREGIPACRFTMARLGVQREPALHTPNTLVS